MIIKRLALGLPLVFCGWIAILALVMRLTGDAPAALVLLPPLGLFAALPPGTAITARGPLSVTVKGRPGLVAALYAAGAPLVLPAGLTGCLPQD
jgi:hypothetical protein